MEFYNFSILAKLFLLVISVKIEFYLNIFNLKNSLLTILIRKLYINK